jgi:CspA family cold shock protein
MHHATWLCWSAFFAPASWALTNATPQNSDVIAAAHGECAAQEHIKEAIMATGTVKFFNSQKGFGFITPADGSKDVFVHISAVERAGMSTLNEGQRINYEVVTERGKLAASNISNA